MSDQSPVTLGLVLAASSLLAYKLHKEWQKPKLVLPPSPKSYPLIGNLLSIPQEFEHLAFMKIGEELGSKYTSSGPIIVFADYS